MILSFISIVANIAFFFFFLLNLFTDKALADGTVKTYHKSPISRLEVADKSGLFYLYIFFAAVSIITGILYLAGVKNSVIKIIQIIALACSAIMFIIIMVTAANTHPRY